MRNAKNCEVSGAVERMSPAAVASQSGDMLMTAAQVARHLQVSAGLVRRLVYAGRLKGFRIGEVGLRFRMKDIEAYLETNQARGPTAVRNGRRSGKRPGKTRGQVQARSNRRPRHPGGQETYRQVRNCRKRLRLVEENHHEDQNR